jgi:hypothetical protein
MKQFVTFKLGCCSMTYSTSRVTSIGRVRVWKRSTVYGLACTCGKVFYVRKGYDAEFWLQRKREADFMRQGKHRWLGI